MSTQAFSVLLLPVTPANQSPPQPWDPHQLSHLKTVALLPLSSSHGLYAWFLGPASPGAPRKGFDSLPSVKL